MKLPWRKAGLLISMIKWTRISRLPIKISLSRPSSGRGRSRGSGASASLRAQRIRAKTGRAWRVRYIYSDHNQLGHHIDPGCRAYGHLERPGTHPATSLGGREEGVLSARQCRAGCARTTVTLFVTAARVFNIYWFTHCASRLEQSRVESYPIAPPFLPLSLSPSLPV